MLLLTNFYKYLPGSRKKLCRFMRKILYILLIIYSIPNLGYGQQAPIFSQYVLNEFVINPSLAGIDGMTSLSFNGRKQWLGYQYSPETYSVSLSTRILKSPTPLINKNKPGAGNFKKGTSGRVGLGTFLMKDRNGATNRTTLSLTYAYHISMYNSQLSFGLSFLANQFRIDEELAAFASPDDPLAGFIGASTYSPDAAVGADFSTPSYHVGFSVYNLFQSPVKFGDASANYKQLQQIRQYYFLGIYKGKIRSISEWSYEAGMIARGNEKLQGTAEISFRAIYIGEYWFGISYRSTKDIIALMGFKYNRFYIGYSFDYGFNELSQLSYGSHEIAVALKLGDSTRRYRFWERY